MNMNNFTKKFIFVGLCALLLSSGMYGQRRFAVKTNIPYWATLSPNAGAEFLLSSNHNYTLEISGGFNPFKISNDKQWKHWVMWAEARYWVFEPFNAHFFGLHYVGGGYNAGGVKLPFNVFEELRTQRADGNVNGIGLSYGYSWIIGNNLTLEATLGAGYARFNYDTYALGENGERKGTGHKDYFGLTKGAISLVYVFK
jgi:hypothetical protein